MKNDVNLKVAIDGTPLFGKSDGSGVYTYNLIENLALIEKKDLFYVYYPNAPLFRKSSLKVKQHNIKPKRSYFGLNFTKGIGVCHDTSMSFLYSGAFGKPAGRLVATIYDSAALSNTRYKRDLTVLDAVITPSEMLKRELADNSGLPLSKISVIRPGIESFFSPVTTYQKSLIKARYSISGSYMIFSGKIEERKNIRRILEAYSALKYESPPLIVFAGETGWLKDSLFDMAKAYGVEKNIRHLGFVPRKHLPALMGAALFMIRPSLYDGFAFPVLEAMASGCPVIASSTTCASELCGDAGLLVDPGETDKIASAMRRLMSDEKLRSSLAGKGLERSTEFSASKMARETLQLYREVQGR